MTCHAQTIIAKHSTKHDLHTGNIPIKAAVKERVIHQPKLFDFLKVAIFLLVNIHAHHLRSNDLPIFYRAFGFFARWSFLVCAKNVIGDFPASFLLRRLHDVCIKISCNGN